MCQVLATNNKQTFIASGKRERLIRVGWSYRLVENIKKQQ